MKYTKEEINDIARLVVAHELTYKQAADKYDVSLPTIANRVRKYKNAMNIETDLRHKPSRSRITSNDLESLNLMTKDQLIDEVIKARIGEERAKKGYEVKGGGQNKEFVSLFSKNTK